MRLLCLPGAYGSSDVSTFPFWIYQLATLSILRALELEGAFTDSVGLPFPPPSSP